MTARVLWSDSNSAFDLEFAFDLKTESGLGSGWQSDWLSASDY